MSRTFPGWKYSFIRGMATRESEFVLTGHSSQRQGANTFQSNPLNLFSKSVTVHYERETFATSQHRIWRKFRRYIFWNGYRWRLVAYSYQVRHYRQCCYVFTFVCLSVKVWWCVASNSWVDYVGDPGHDADTGIFKRNFCQFGMGQWGQLCELFWQLNSCRQILMQAEIINCQRR